MGLFFFFHSFKTNFFFKNVTGTSFVFLTLKITQVLPDATAKSVIEVSALLIYLYVLAADYYLSEILLLA